MNVTVCCVLRSGGVFTPTWVARLKRQVDAHIKPDRFVCLTDEPHALHVCECEGLAHAWPGWFSKFELFRPGLFAGPVLYFDLDSVLLAPIPGLQRIFELGRDGRPPLALLDDFYRPKEPASGVMAWVPCEETERIYHDFVKAPRISDRWNRGDGWIIGQYPHVRLQLLCPGVFGSLKAHKLNDGPKDFAHVSCHGKPKFNDLPESHWLVKAWKGKTP